MHTEAWLGAAVAGLVALGCSPESEGGGGDGGTGGVSGPEAGAGGSSVIPADRLVPWSPGVRGGLPDPATACPASAAERAGFRRARRRGHRRCCGLRCSRSPRHRRAAPCACRPGPTSCAAGSPSTRASCCAGKVLPPAACCSKATRRASRSSSTTGATSRRCAAGLARGTTELDVDDASGFVGGRVRRDPADQRLVGDGSRGALAQRDLGAGGQPSGR